MLAKKKDIIASLESLGLSNYESKAYLAALGQPPITSYKLAQLSGVPRARIYEIVEKLEARGLLVFQSGNRTLLTASNYQKFLDRKESEYRENIERLRLTFSAIPAAETAGIWNIKGRDRVIQTAADILAAAGKYAYLEAIAEDIQEIRAVLQNLLDKKIAVHGIFCGDLQPPVPGMVKHLGESVPVCGEIAVVADGKQALIGFTRPSETAAAAVTQNEGIVQIAKEYIRHEVFLNSLFSGEDQADKSRYVQQYRKLMRRLP